MRKRSVPVILFVAVAFCVVLPLRTLAQAPGDRVRDRYIVRVADGANPAAVAARNGVVPAATYRVAVNGFAGFVPPGLLRKLAADADVLDVAPDRVVVAIAKGGVPGKPDKPDDPGDEEPPAPSQEVPAGVARIGAAPGAELPVTGAGVGVAVVDTGLDFGHPDLMVAAQGFVSPGVGASPQDDNGHGTHVGGTVAALDNTVDVVGVAPGATLYAVKVLDYAGSGYDSDIVAGLDWIASNAQSVAPPIAVVNMSLGRPGSLDDNTALHAAVQTLTDVMGITVVVSAGNDCGSEVWQQVPATYPEVIAVASTTARDGVSTAKRFPVTIPQDTASYFTTDGAFDTTSGIGVTISAPGERQEDIDKRGFIVSQGILSTWLGGGTERMSGTSMAAPHVAGVAALLYEQAALLIAPEDVRLKLVSGADRVGIAPLDSPTGCYSYDDDREGVLSAPGALAAPLP